MALNDVISAPTRQAGDKEAFFVGLKLKTADYDELCELLGVAPSIGPASVFRQMLAVVIEAKRQ